LYFILNFYETKKNENLLRDTYYTNTSYLVITMKKKIIASLLAIVVIGWSTVVLSGCVEGQVSVERYIQALKDRDSDVREEAAEALG